MREFKFNILAGIFLTSLSGLMLEVTLSRIFSSTIWYHYAFIAISVALLGWGMGGFLFHIIKRNKKLNGRLADLLSVFSLIFSFSTAYVLWAMNQMSFSSSHLTFYFIISLIPFFFAGMTIALAFDFFPDAIPSLYFADLVGASFGSLSIPFILNRLGGESTMLAVALFLSLASVFFSACASEGFRKKVLLISLVNVCLMSGLILGNNRFGILRMKEAPGKGLYQHLKENPNLRIAFTKWNAFSKIDAVEGFDDTFLARIYIDSDAWTNVIRWDGRIESMQKSKAWFRYIPFHLQNHPKTLIIGPGGGVDVLLSLVAESQEVTAVELNPIIIDYVRSRGALTGHLYDRPNVKVFVEEGRNFISRSKEKYDVILLGWVDSWASITSGGLALSENYLYTTEAFEQYYQHLTDDGMLAFIRWPVDTPRLVSNSIAMLQNHGVSTKEAGDHLAVLIEGKPAREDEPPPMLFLLKKAPFTYDQSAKIMEVAKPFTPVYVPYFVASAPYKELFSGELTLQKFYSSFAIKVEPVYDDSPFYFAMDKPFGIPNFLSGLFVTPLLLGLAMGAISITFPQPNGGKVAGVTSLFYFAALGFGFIFLEISLLQKFTLLLGHPTVTLSVILFSLLISSGVGSYLSGKIKEENIFNALKMIFPMIFAIALTYSVLFPQLIDYVLPLPKPTRILMTWTLIFPLGFLLGMPFPLGLRVIKSRFNESVSLMWGLNGMISVLGSILATVLGLGLGFNRVILLGGLWYVMALVSSTIWRRKLTKPS